MEQPIYKVKESGGQYSVFFHGSGNKPSAVSARADITCFSRKSASRMSDYLRSCKARYEFMGTLTYAPDGNYLDCKKHLRAFLQAIRRYAVAINREHDFSLFWFLEFTAAGRPHFHFYSNFRIERYWLSATWYRIAGNGNPKHLAAGTRIERLRSGREGQAGYAFKYASKNEQKTVPDLFKGQKIGRFWSVVGHSECVVAATTLRASTDAVSNIFHLIQICQAALEHAEKQGKARKVVETGAFVKWVIEDDALRWDIHRAILGEKEAKKCLENAITNRIERHRGSLEPRTLAEWHAQQWRMANPLKISARKSKSAYR